MSTNIESILSSLDSLLEAKTNALSTGFNKVRFLENCKSYLPDVKHYQDYPAEVMAQLLFKGAVLGLDFLARECHILTSGTEPQFQTDYKGEKKLAKKYSVRPLVDVYAKNVREGDDFREEIKDGKPLVSFLPLPFNDSKIVGTFAVALFEDGGMIYETLSSKEIDEIRKHYGKNPNSETWEKSQGEMNKRTALRRLCKHIELDFDTNQALAFEAGSGFDFSQAPKPAQNSPLNLMMESEEKQDAID